jgi:hypothetical protein
MRRILFLALIMVLAQTVCAQNIEPNMKWGKPTEQELTMTEYPDDKDADAVVLFNKLDVFYGFTDGDFKVYYVHKTRLKVLKPEGKRVADKSIIFQNNVSNSTRREIVTGLKAIAYNMENGKLVKTKMERSMVNEERLDKYQKQLKFSVPKVKVGTVIEYEYRIESDYFYNIRDWYAQYDIPVLYTSYELSIPEWFKFNIEETGSHPTENKTTETPMTLYFNGDSEIITSNVRTFIARKLPAIKGDNYLWCPEYYSNKVTAELAGIYIPGAVYKDYTTSWDDIDKQLLEDDEFGGRLKKSSPLKADIVAAGIPGIADKKERFAAVWNLLKSKVRWNGDYAFWGQSASKILKDGTGTNADINFLLINMLHDADIDAVPVVLRTRNLGNLPLTHASMKYLNTFVVGIYIDGATMTFFDSSAEDGYLNALPAKLLVNRARLVKKDAPGEWVDLQAPAQGREMISILSQLDANGLLKGKKTSRLYEEAAATLRRTWRLAKDSVEQIHKFQEEDDIEIQEYNMTGRTDFSPTMDEQITFTKQCDAAGDIIYLNPLVMIPFKEAPFTAAERTLPVEFPYKQSVTINSVISLPKGYAVEEMPKPIMLKLDGITVRIGSTISENQLNTQLKFNLSKTFYTQTDYQDLKALFDRLTECNKNIITIKKAE